MRQFCRKVIRYTAGLSAEEFEAMNSFMTLS
jgi:hypothetical protein